MFTGLVDGLKGLYIVDQADTGLQKGRTGLGDLASVARESQTAGRHLLAIANILRACGPGRAFTRCLDRRVIHIQKGLHVHLRKIWIQYRRVPSRLGLSRSPVGGTLFRFGERLGAHQTYATWLLDDFFSLTSEISRRLGSPSLPRLA